MCFATIGAIAAVAGTAMSAVGAISQGNAAAGASRDAARAQQYQAQVAENNAKVAEQNAQRAEQIAQNNALAKSMESAARLGKVKAGQAASGIDINTGSSVDVQAGTRMLGKLDTDTVFSNDLLKAYGYRSDAQNFRTQGALSLYRASGLYDRAQSEETSGYLKAGGTVLSNLSGLPLKWGGGGDFTGTEAGTSQYGSPAYENTSAYGGPR